MSLLRRRQRPKSSLFPYTTLFRSVSKPWFSSMRRIWKTSVGESSIIRMSAMHVLPSFPVDVPFDRGQELVARRSEEHTSELQSQSNLVCSLLLEKKKKR